jgi:hypothetical protein
MSTPNNRPLWEVMIAAGLQGNALNGRVEDGEAARLRAIADVVAPEEPAPIRDQYLTERFWFMVYTVWEERQRIRALLLAEAKRAEVEQ